MRYTINVLVYQKKRGKKMKRDDVWMILGVAVVVVLLGVVGGNDFEDRTALLTMSVQTEPFNP
jgi:Tfp pilus assembly protein PilN